MNGRTQSILMLFAGVAALLVAAGLAARVDPTTYAGGRDRDEDQRLQRNSSALAAMLGEFRTSISDIMFIKTERYLHGGIAYRPHHGETGMSAEELADEVEEHQSELTPTDRALRAEIDVIDVDNDHAGTPTFIPSADEDFRGWIGHLYRQVKPWRHPDLAHWHTDGRQLLPWYRVMTLTDPHYIRGYTIGGFWLQRDSLDAALAFIEEGLEKNPDSFELYVSRGFMRVRQERRAREEMPPEESLALLQAARDDFRRAAEIGLRQRPDDVDEEGFGSGGWSSYMDNDLLAACRMDIMLTERLDDTATARQRANLYIPFFPELGNTAGTNAS